MRIAEAGQGSGPGLLASYGYDSLGQLTSFAYGGSSYGQSYAYDGIGRLATLGSTFPDAGRNDLEKLTFGPDSRIRVRANSNNAFDWQAPQGVSQGYGVNGLNQIAWAGITRFSYDGAGRLAHSGYEYIFSGGSAEADLIVASGHLVVSGSAFDETVGAGGLAFLASGGSLVSSVLEAGASLTGFGGQLSAVTVCRGASVVLNGEMVSAGETLIVHARTATYSQGGLDVMSGGQVEYLGATVESGGVLTVAADATVSSLVISAGGIAKGPGFITDNFVDNGVVSGASIRFLDFELGGSAVADVFLG